MTTDLKRKAEILTTESTSFLRKEAPSAFKDLRQLLNDCYRFINKSQPAQPEKSKPKIKIPLTKKEKLQYQLQQQQQQQQELEAPQPAEEVDDISLLEDQRIVQFKSVDGVTLTGFLILDGVNVSEAELNVKFQKWNKNLPFKTSVKASHPYRIPQLYSLLNLMEEGVSEIDAVFNDFGPDFSTFDIVTAEKVTTMLHKIIVNAQKQLVSAPRHKIPKPLPPSHQFSPSLRKDLVVEFGIYNKSVVVTVLTIAPVKDTLEKDKKGSTLKIVNASVPAYQNNSQYFTIQDKVVIENNTKKVQTIFQFLEKAYNLISEIQDKVVSLTSYNF
eukprot:TRINITY_DN1691_c0_g1_i1.p1 TRINITY_DN1691_c0_g1~~TRINITY_DN1691_c0_g1_i1.p1  ORF type:complete len:346 (-),score=78.82 TRINITY_DN1691_c0_g1_i1:64-1050(-)